MKIRILKTFITMSFDSFLKLKKDFTDEMGDINKDILIIYSEICQDAHSSADQYFQTNAKPYKIMHG